MKIENCFSPKFNSNRSSSNGYFYQSWSDNSNIKIFHTEGELHQYKNQIRDILNNDGNGKLGKVLYVGKGSNAPRHKIKMLVEENKIKKTSIIENSDTVIFDKKIIEDIAKWFNTCSMVKIAIVPFTQEIYTSAYTASNGNGNYIDRWKEYLKKPFSMVIYEEDYVTFPKEFKQILGGIDWVECYEQNNYRTKNIQDVFDTIQFYFENPHGNIIWDSNILETLNSDGIDLDEEYVSTLNNMFASNDSDNIRLAIEMMSNVNLNKWGLTIALLLNKWKHNMNWGMGNTGSQAYKTLDRYFMNKGIDWKRDYRSFSAGLYKNYSHDENAKRVIEDFVLQNINRYLAKEGFGHIGCLLQIDNFKISLHHKK
jgi:hypothetical protein